jgi:hypothetical protein
VNQTAPIVRSLPRRLGNALVAFVSAPASARPLAFFRIGLGAVLLAQATAVAGHLLELYGNQGIVQWSVAEPLAPAGVPRISWLAAVLAPFGAGEASCVRAVFLLYVAGLAGLLLGWRTRASACVAWLTHVALGVSGATASYGADQFATLSLFYCTWMPVGGALSVDRWRAGGPVAPSASARLSLRVLQLQLCIAYFASGVEKASGEQWRNGEAVWRAVMRPDLNQADCTWLAAVPWVALLACWGTLAVEVGYAFLIWPRRTRTAWAVATIGLHVGIALAMGLWSFSGLMIVLTASAFLVSPDRRERLTGAGQDPQPRRRTLLRVHREPDDRRLDQPVGERDLVHTPGHLGGGPAPGPGLGCP